MLTAIKKDSVFFIIYMKSHSLYYAKIVKKIKIESQWIFRFGQIIKIGLKIDSVRPFSGVAPGWYQNVARLEFNSSIG